MAGVLSPWLKSYFLSSVTSATVSGCTVQLVSVLDVSGVFRARISDGTHSVESLLATDAVMESVRYGMIVNYGGLFAFDNVCLGCIMIGIER